MVPAAFSLHLDGLRVRHHRPEILAAAAAVACGLAAVILGAEAHVWVPAIAMGGVACGWAALVGRLARMGRKHAKQSWQRRLYDIAETDRMIERAGEKMADDALAAEVNGVVAAVTEREGPAASLQGSASNAPDLAELSRLRSAAVESMARGASAEAVSLLERASQLAPQDRELLLALCDAYSAAQRGRDAAQVLEKVIAAFGNQRTKEVALYHHRLGLALAKLGDMGVALTQLDMAFKIDPGSVTVLRDLGVLAYKSNDLDRAQRTFRALLLQRLEPAAGISKGDIFYYLGEISAKQGDKAKALQMFERAIETDPALELARTKLFELRTRH